MSGENEVAYLSAVELVELYGKKALSPVEVARLLFDRIDELQPKINTFCVVDHEGALAAARSSEERWRRDEPQGLLDGVPVADIQTWERKFHVFMDAQFPQVGDRIAKEKVLSKETEADLRRGIETFTKQFMAEKK